MESAAAGQAIVRSRGGTDTGALVLVAPVVRAAEDRSETGAAARANVGDAGLDVVDAPAVPIVRRPGDQPQPMIHADPRSRGTGELGQRAAVLQIRVAAQAVERKEWAITGGAGHEIHGAADRVGLHVGGECLVQLDLPQDLGWDDVELHIPDAPLRRWHVNSVDRHVAETGLGAPYLDVLALPFIALQCHAGKPAHRVRDVGVG